MDIVHACVDAKTGKVKIPGFYEDVVRADKGRDQEFPAVWISSEQVQAGLWIQDSFAPGPAEVMRRI